MCAKPHLLSETLWSEVRLMWKLRDTFGCYEIGCKEVLQC